jgi:hypothetical protein
MSPEMLMWWDAIDSFYEWAAFGIVILSGFGVFMLAALFIALLIRGIWRWLTGESWNRVLLSAERRALRESQEV